VRWTWLYTPAALVAVTLAACRDSTGFELHPLLVTDTVLVAAPLPHNSGLPTALDVTSDGFGGVNGGRFPERSGDALEWDFVPRIRGGELVLIPARGVGVVESRAALTPPIPGETFAGLREAPGQGSFVTDSPIAMRVGNVYAARSREAAGGFFGTCVQFAKLEPLAVDAASGHLRILITTNERCGDPRLAPID
jgi:hypothetical protein